MCACWGRGRKIFEDDLNPSCHWLGPLPSKNNMAYFQKHILSVVYATFSVKHELHFKIAVLNFHSLHVLGFFFFGQIILTLNTLVSQSQGFISGNNIHEDIWSTDNSRYCNFILRSSKLHTYNTLFWYNNDYFYCIFSWEQHWHH